MASFFIFFNILKIFFIINKEKLSYFFKKVVIWTKFLESYFESIAIGLYSNIDEYIQDDIALLQSKIDDIDNHIPKALNTSSRIPKTVSFGKEYFKKWKI